MQNGEIKDTIIKKKQEDVEGKIFRASRVRKISLGLITLDINTDTFKGQKQLRLICSSHPKTQLDLSPYLDSCLMKRVAR